MNHNINKELPQTKLGKRTKWFSESVTELYHYYLREN